MHGDLSAVVTEIGATLRSFRFRSSPIIWEFPAEQIDSGSRGQVLAPWPNRLEDGSYRFGTIVARAPLDEPERRNAIHGLVRWMAWTIEDRCADRGESLLCNCIPSPPTRSGSVSSSVMRSTRTASRSPARRSTPDQTSRPSGVGFHPYLLGGAGGIDEAHVRLLASRRLLLDERGLPVGEEAVLGSSFELDGRRLGGVVLDDCYTDLATDPDGRWHASVDLGETCSEIWADAVFAYAMCYTGDTLAGSRRPPPGHGHRAHDVSAKRASDRHRRHRAPSRRAVAGELGVSGW